jgi:twitching motility protein PilT
MARIDELFRYVRQVQASDLHLGTGIAPHVRRHGALEPVEAWAPLDDAKVRSLVYEILTPAQRADYDRTCDLDFAYGVEGVGRFRCNCFVEEAGAAAAFRMIPERIVPLAELSLPPAVETLAHLRSGLVLVTGPTGSGKSTTLAAIVDRVNETYARHVVTIEDPVEFVHHNKRSVISQRQVGSDTQSFGAALRAAMRQDADVILVGEMRDLETIALAITAAEMGALVLGTLHTNGAVKTVDRIIDAFAPEQQPQVRSSLSESLQAVVAQLLVRTATGTGRVAASEVLLTTPALPNIIREGKTSMIHTVIAGGRRQGMQSMDDSLHALLQAGQIAVEEAYLKAHDKKRFETLLPA